MKYHVKYYDPKLSKKGKGTQVAAFKTRSEAEEFAGRNQIYSMPCRVELVAEEEDEAKLLAMRLSEEQAALFGIGFLLIEVDGSVRNVHPSRVRLDGDGYRVTK